ncbi:unnamed protein product, partial [Ectocarpus sp. 6 AP-2014]
LSSSNYRRREAQPRNVISRNNSNMALFLFIPLPNLLLLSPKNRVVHKLPPLFRNVCNGLLYLPHVAPPTTVLHRQPVKVCDGPTGNENRPRPVAEGGRTNGKCYMRQIQASCMH